MLAMEPRPQSGVNNWITGDFAGGIAGGQLLSPCEKFASGVVEEGFSILASAQFGEHHTRRSGVLTSDAKELSETTKAMFRFLNFHYDTCP